MTPHLSIVAVARNDNHGHNMLYRLQHFVSGWVEQCRRHDLSAELIIVEWNPPAGKGLADVLQLPAGKGPCTIRFIRVPRHVHATFDHADKIPLFQMIGKNIGIRRARGEFVLATNIDILFSDSLMHYLKHKLKKECLYRVDRLDVPARLPDQAKLDEILSFCSRSFFRINKKCGTRWVVRGDFWAKVGQVVQLCKLLAKQFVTTVRKAISLRPHKMKKLAAYASECYKALQRVAKKIICAICPACRRFPHTNACGDFTLLSRDAWKCLKGYPEWALYSWHLDSVLIHQARQHGLLEVDLPKKYAIYHIDHEHGYSADRPQELFDRLETLGVPYLTDPELSALVAKLRKSKEPVIYNGDNWGLADKELEEFSI